MSALSNEATVMDNRLVLEKDKWAGKYYGRNTAYYKGLLFIQDVVLSVGVFILGWHIFRSDLLDAGATEITVSIIIGLVAISYLTAFNTYNYHLIYSKTNHISMLIRAIGWGGVTIGCINIIYMWPELLEGAYFIPTMIVLAAVVLILNRFFSDQLLTFLIAVGISFIAMAVIEVVTPSDAQLIIVDPWATPVSLILSALMVIAGRLFTVEIIFNKLLRKRFRRQIAIIGSDQDAKNVGEHIFRNNAPFYVVGFIRSWQADNCTIPMEIEKKCLGSLESLPEIAAENNINEIIITDERIDKMALITVLDFCTTKRIAVWFPTKLMPIIGIKLYIDDFCDIPMIRIGSQNLFGSYARIKYALDATLTLVIFLLQLPIFLFIAFAIKKDSKGPVFYRARAIGRNGREFAMLKFRSMYMDNDPSIHKEYVTKLIKGEIGDKSGEGQTLKITNDPRVTPVGRILRKLSLDELPQLINVLKGDMSLIGPRPCLPYEYEIYANWHKKRTAVRPGISGLWQVTGRSEVSFEDMILLDLYYTYNASPALDYSILFETIFVVLGKKGAY